MDENFILWVFVISICKFKIEPSWKFIHYRDHTSLTSSHGENIFEWFRLLKVSNEVKKFVRIRIKYTSYTHKLSNVTNFPGKKRWVVIFTIFIHAREFDNFIEEIGAGRQTDHTTLEPIERHWGQQGYRNRRQRRSYVNFVKTMICTELFSYK